MRINKAVILVILLVSSSLSSAQKDQKATLDSLYAVWEDTNLSDSIRLDAFKIYIFDGFIYSSPNEAVELTNEMIGFSVKNENLFGESLGLNLKGIALRIQGHYEEAIACFRSSLAIREKLGNQKSIASALNNLGNTYSDQGNYLKALDCYQRSLKIHEGRDDQAGIPGILGNIGAIYQEIGNFDKAMEYNQRCLKIQEELDDKIGASNTLNNIGTIYHTQANYSKAMEYYHRALANHEELSDKRGISISLLCIGNVYHAQKDNSKALDYHTRSLKIAQEIGDKRLISSLLNNIGQIYFEEGDPVKALDFLLKGLSIAQDIGALELQKNANSTLYNIYKAMGKAGQALVYLEQLNSIEDSLQAEETSKKLQQMEFAKQVYADSMAQVEKERQIELAHEKEVRRKNRSRNIILGSGIMALFLAGGFYSRWRYVRKAKNIIEKEKDRSENLLLNILPAEIAEELKQKGKADARDFDQVTILFTDFKEFTQTSRHMDAKSLVEEINTCFKAFDQICGKYGVEKIKTIGDSYMAAGGLPLPSDDSVKNTVLAGLEMADFISNRKAERESQGQIPFEMRVGIHTGPVVAGIVGVKKFQYDIWGDTVNTASRMESNGNVGKVNISQHTYEMLKDDPEFSFTERGMIDAKGLGEVRMYFVERMSQ